MADYRNINDTATTSEQSEEIRFNQIVLVANDDNTNDLIISFGEPISAGNYCVLKPGETLENLSMVRSSVYYKSSAGTVAFRCYTLLY
jgi:DNA gyrase inhibitor GyrI